MQTNHVSAHRLFLRGIPSLYGQQGGRDDSGNRTRWRAVLIMNMRHAVEDSFEDNALGHTLVSQPQFIGSPMCFLPNVIQCNYLEVPDDKLLYIGLRIYLNH